MVQPKITNPNLGNLTSGDVTRLRNAVDIINQIVPVWSQDPRYSPQVDQLTNTAAYLSQLADQVAAYLLVQGT